MIVLAWLGAARSLDSQFSPLAKEQLEKEKEKEKLLKEKSSVEAATKEGTQDLLAEVKLNENGSAHESEAAEKVSNESTL